MGFSRVGVWGVPGQSRGSGLFGLSVSASSHFGYHSCRFSMIVHAENVELLHDQGLKTRFRSRLSGEAFLQTAVSYHVWAALCMSVRRVGLTSTISSPRTIGHLPHLLTTTSILVDICPHGRHHCQQQRYQYVHLPRIIATEAFKIVLNALKTSLALSEPNQNL